MIKLKDILLENTAPSIFTARRTDDRQKRQAANIYRKYEAVVKEYIAGGSKGSLVFSHGTDFSLTGFPHILKNVIVDGNFTCNFCNLKSLKNSPKQVNGMFACSYNKLQSLEGITQNVRDIIFCDFNKLSNLKGLPTHKSYGIYCNNQEVQEFSLVGAPEIVDGTFNCSGNYIFSLEGCPKKVTLGFYMKDNESNVRFTEEQIKAVCDVGVKIQVD